jgi:hypothetical protein
MQAMKNVDPPLLLLGLSVAAVGAMMLVGQGAAKGAPLLPPPGPLEPPTGPGTPGQVTVPAGRRAQITMTSQGATFGPDDEKSFRAMASVANATVESVTMTPNRMVVVMRLPKDRSYTVNTPITMSNIPGVSTQMQVVLL